MKSSWYQTKFALLPLFLFDNLLFNYINPKNLAVQLAEGHVSSWVWIAISLMDVLKLEGVVRRVFSGPKTAQTRAFQSPAASITPPLANGHWGAALLVIDFIGSLVLTSPLCAVDIRLRQPPVGKQVSRGRFLGANFSISWKSLWCWPACLHVHITPPKFNLIIL